LEEEYVSGQVVEETAIAKAQAVRLESWIQDESWIQTNLELKLSYTIQHRLFVWEMKYMCTHVYIYVHIYDHSVWIFKLQMHVSEMDQTQRCRVTICEVCVYIHIWIILIDSKHTKRWQRFEHFWNAWNVWMLEQTQGTHAKSLMAENGGAWTL
jgi:hypothetical protein